MPTAKGEQSESSSLQDELAGLESEWRLKPPGSATISDRIENLEKLVFGETRPGSLFERLDKLKVSSQFQGRGQSPVPFEKPMPQAGAPAQNEIGSIVKMLPLSNESKVTFVRIEFPYENLSQVGDYFDVVVNASKHKLLRFDHMPVPIYITPFADENFMRACIGAFESWEERSNGVVRFTQVADPSQARIRVIWSHLGLGKNPNDCVLGAHTITQWQTAPGTRITALVFGGIPVSIPTGFPKYVVQPQVIEVNLDLIQAKPEETRLPLLKNVIAHELGHAVGLMGHSPQSSDLMNAVTDECSRLSQRDINTLIKLYQSPVDIAL